MRGGSRTTSGKSRLLVPLPTAETIQMGTAVNRGQDQGTTQGPYCPLQPPLPNAGPQCRAFPCTCSMHECSCCCPTPQPCPCTTALTLGTPLQSPAQLLASSVYIEPLLPPLVPQSLAKEHHSLIESAQGIAVHGTVIVGNCQLPPSLLGLRAPLAPSSLTLAKSLQAALKSLSHRRRAPL